MSAMTAAENELAEVRSHYAERFRDFAASLPGSEPQWLEELRSAAIGRFDLLGFPTTRDEDWRYTNIASLARRPLEGFSFSIALSPFSPATIIDSW